MHSQLSTSIPQRSFVSNVLYLAGGTVIGQFILLLISPLLTRLFSPEDFGALAVFTSLLGVLSVISTMRYEMAIPLNRSSVGAATTALLCTLVLITYILLTEVSLYFVSDSLSRSFNISKTLLSLLTAGIGTLSLFQILRYLSVSQSNFKLISRASIFQSLGVALSQLVAGLVNLGSIGLVSGVILGRLLGVAFLAKNNITIFKKARLKRLPIFAMKYKKFPIFTTWASLINVLGMQATPLIFSYFFNLSIAGLVALTMRVLGTPSVLIGQAIGQVFYKQAVINQNRQDANKKLVMQLVKLLFLLAFPAFACVALFGSEAFAFVFGKEWEQAGKFAQYFSPWLFLSFISSPLSTIALVKGKQRTAFLITVYETILRIAVLLLGAVYGSVELTIISFSGVGVLISLIYIMWVLVLSGSSIFEWIMANRNILLKAMLLCFSLIIASKIPDTALSLIVAVALLVGFYIYSLKSIVSCLRGMN